MAEHSAPLWRPVKVQFVHLHIARPPPQPQLVVPRPLVPPVRSPLFLHFQAHARLDVRLVARRAPKRRVLLLAVDPPPVVLQELLVALVRVLPPPRLRAQPPPLALPPLKPLVVPVRLRPVVQRPRVKRGVVLGVLPLGLVLRVPTKALGPGRGSPLGLPKSTRRVAGRGRQCLTPTPSCCGGERVPLGRFRDRRGRRLDLRGRLGGPCRGRRLDLRGRRPHHCMSDPQRLGEPCGSPRAPLALPWTQTLPRLHAWRTPQPRRGFPLNWLPHRGPRPHPCPRTSRCSPL